MAPTRYVFMYAGLSIGRDNDGELVTLVKRVFDVRESDRALAVLCDLPDAQLEDNTAWRDRRRMAASWAAARRSSGRRRTRRRAAKSPTAACSRGLAVVPRTGQKSV